MSWQSNWLVCERVPILGRCLLGITVRQTQNRRALISLNGRATKPRDCIHGSTAGRSCNQSQMLPRLPHRMYFSAGPNHNSGGLFGYMTAVSTEDRIEKVSLFSSGICDRHAPKYQLHPHRRGCPGRWRLGRHHAFRCRLGNVQGLRGRRVKSRFPDMVRNFRQNLNERRGGVVQAVFDCMS